MIEVRQEFFAGILFLLLLGCPGAVAELSAQGSRQRAAAWLDRVRQQTPGPKDSTEYWLDLALEDVKLTDAPRLEADILAELADVYRNSGRFENNLTASRRAQELYRSLGATADEAYVTHRLAESFRRMGDVQNDESFVRRGLNYALESVKLARHSGDTTVMIEAYNTLGSVYRELHDWPAARAAYQEGLRLVKGPGTHNRAVANLRLNIGQWHMDHDDDYEELISLVREVQGVYEEIGDRRGTEAAFRNLSHAYGHLGDLDQAVEYGLRSVHEAQEIGDPHLLYLAYLNLGEQQEAVGDYHSALISYRAADEYREATLNLEQAQAIARLETQYETQLKEVTIAAREAELKRARDRQLLALVGLLLFAALAFIAWRVAYVGRRNNRELARRNADIEAKRAEIAEKNRLNEALVHEIHHRVKNNLQVIWSLLNLQSHHMEAGDALDALQAGQRRIKSISLLHQSLYQSSDPGAIEMRSYIDLLLKSIGKAFGLDAAKIRLVNEVQVFDLDVDRAVPVGLIVNELVTNALKYAFPGGRSGTVTVSLTEQAGRFFLRVADDGVGLASTTGKGGGTRFGTKLVGILAGKLRAKINTTSGRGTVVELEFAARVITRVSA